MTWEDQFNRWIQSEEENPYDDRTARLIIIETRKAARNQGILDTPAGWEWVGGAIKDKNRRGFVHAVFRRQAAPKHLAPLFLQMAIEEQDPSANRLYIEPAVRAVGARRVLARLLEVLREGTEQQQGGAVSASYWVQGDGSNTRYQEVRAQFRDEMLKMFIKSGSPYVQQRIIPTLSMDAAHYSPEVAALLPTAITLARSHSDAYVRHRIEIQLGEGGPLKALPR